MGRGLLKTTYARLNFRQDIPRDTDLNDACVTRICESIKGQSVLEVGCGRGMLSFLLSKRFDITACDLVKNDSFDTHTKRMTFVRANVEHLPFSSKSFDTVICAHTLEHVIDIARAVRELRRVTRRRLIIVIPLQRPYRYTFDLHLHFFPFPYPETFEAFMGYKKGKSEVVDGDLFYMEEIS